MTGSSKKNGYRTLLSWLLAVCLLAWSAPAFAGAAPGAPVPIAAPNVRGIMAPTPVPRFLQAGVNPATMLRSAIAKVEAGGTVNVCAVGDSTFTVGTPSAQNGLEGKWQFIQSAFQNQNPGVKFNFMNFAIPGQTFGSYLTNVQPAAISSGLAWYNSAALWFQFPQNASCDIIPFDFGVNDSYAFGSDSLRAVINNTASSLTRPGLIFLTSDVANAAAGGVFAQPAYQAGYISTPSLLRSAASLGPAGFTAAAFTNPVAPWGLIDIGRFFTMAVLGKDYEDQTSIDSTASVSTLTPTISGTNTNFAFPKTDGDFSINMTFPSTAALAASANNTVFFVVGASDGQTTNANVIYFLVANGGTTVYANYSTSAFNQISAATGSLPASTSFNVLVESKRNVISFSVNGFSLFHQAVIKSTAPFTPQVYVGPTFAAPVTPTINHYATGTARAYNPILSATDVYGPNIANIPATAATAAGGTVLTFASVPASATVGLPISDVQYPNAIPAGATVAAVTATTITIDSAHPVGSIGVSIGDNISMGSLAGSNGNGINHLASAGLNYLYNSAISSANLCLICYTENGSSAASRTTVVPVAAGTTAATQSLRHLTLNPAATIASYTVTMPTYPIDGDQFDITEAVSTNNVTALTVQAPTTTPTATVASPSGLALSAAVPSHLWRFNGALAAWVQRN